MTTAGQRPEEHEDGRGAVQAAESAGAAGSVSLLRLLSVAALTPGQASLVAVQLLNAAQGRETGGAEHVAEPVAGAGLGTATLTSSGAVDVRAAHAGETTALSELLEQLLDNVRLPAHPRPEQRLLLHRLEQVAAEPLRDPGARARELQDGLAETLGPDARERLSRQLAALVDAFRLVAPSASTRDDAGTVDAQVRPTSAPAVLSSAGWAAPASVRRLPHRAATQRDGGAPRRARPLLRRRTRGRRVVLVALVLVAALAGTGYLVARGSGLGVIESLAPGTRPAAPTTTAPARVPKQTAKKPRPHRTQAVPALAGRHAGPITGVVLAKAGTCRPGTLCTVKVTVHFRPVSTTRLVAWKVGAVRVCKRGITWFPPVTVTAQPGWNTVYAHTSVRVPNGHRLALFALATAPARAQSRPVPVTGSSLHC